MISMILIDISDIGNKVTSKPDKSKLQHKIGVELSKYMISKKMKIKYGDIKLKVDEYGKPYFNGCHFNVSHSNNIVACVISDDKIGIDVEYMKQRTLKISKYCFSDEEQWKFEKVCNEDKWDYFYKLWTIKESYLKALGLGFFKPLKSFTVLHENFKDIHIVKDSQYKFKLFDIQKNYAICICCHGEIEIKSINVFSYLDFMNIVKKSFD